MFNLKQKIESEFNDFALINEPGYFNQFVDFIKSKIDLHDKSILEFGCGNGDLSINLLKSGARLVKGIDISEPSIREAQKKAENIENINFYLGDIFNMKFKNSSFNIIISHSVLHYIPGDLSSILNLFRDLLCKDGVLIASFEVSNKFDFIHYIQKTIFILFPKSFKKYLVYFFKIYIKLFYDKDGISNISHEILSGKSRYLGIPILQRKNKYELKNIFKKSQYKITQIYNLPLLNRFSKPHYLIIAYK